MSDSKATILVADSNAESLFAIAAALATRDHIVKTAASAGQAVEIASQCSLDLLITDFKLRDQAGDALIRDLRMASKHADLPVMFVSENQASDVIRRSYESGASYHLKKPIDPTVLGELVDKALWMPHLISAHVQQKVVRMPHLSFARNPMAGAWESSPAPPGTPITF